MKRLYLISVVLILALALAACGSSGSDNPQATQPTAAPEPTAHATQSTQPTASPTVPAATQSAQPTAAELIQLVQISSVDGKVTDATLPPHGQGKVGVGFDVTINHPTQARIKQVSYEILSTVLQVSAVDAANCYFHANGYTGMNDPIATDGAVVGEVNWAAFDANSAWDATGGVFQVDLPA